MSQTTRMTYQVNGPNECIESICHSLASARYTAHAYLKASGQPEAYIYRYDRAGKSNYCELVETVYRRPPYGGLCTGTLLLTRRAIRTVRNLLTKVSK